MKKKLLAVVVAVMAASGVTACGGSASETDEKEKFEAVNEAVGHSESGSDYYRTEDGFLFQDAEGGVALFRYEGKEENVVVPETYEGKSVVALGESCFSMDMHNESGLISVTLPDSVTQIADYAFGECKKLTGVALLDSVTALGKAFHNCDQIVVTYNGISYTDDTMDDLYELFDEE